MHMPCLKYLKICVCKYKMFLRVNYCLLVNETCHIFVGVVSWYDLSEGKTGNEKISQSRSKYTEI